MSLGKKGTIHIVVTQNENGESVSKEGNMTNEQIMCVVSYLLNDLIRGYSDTMDIPFCKAKDHILSTILAYMKIIGRNNTV